MRDVDPVTGYECELNATGRSPHHISEFDNPIPQDGSERKGQTTEGFKELRNRISLIFSEWQVC